MRDDLMQERGFGLLDPHGDLAEAILRFSGTTNGAPVLNLNRSAVPPSSVRSR